MYKTFVLTTFHPLIRVFLSRKRFNLFSLDFSVSVKKASPSSIFNISSVKLQVVLFCLRNNVIVSEKETC